MTILYRPSERDAILGEAERKVEEERIKLKREFNLAIAELTSEIGGAGNGEENITEEQ